MSATTERPARMHTCTGPHLHPFRHGSVELAFPAGSCRQAVGAGGLPDAGCTVQPTAGRKAASISPLPPAGPRGQSVPPHLSWRTAVGCISRHSLLQECPCLNQVWAGSRAWSCQAPVNTTCSALPGIARTKGKKVWEEKKGVPPPSQGPATETFLSPCGPQCPMTYT